MRLNLLIVVALLEDALSDGQHVSSRLHIFWIVHLLFRLGEDVARRGFRAVVAARVRNLVFGGVAPTRAHVCVASFVVDVEAVTHLVNHLCCLLLQQGPQDGGGSVSLKVFVCRHFFGLALY